MNFNSHTNHKILLAAISSGFILLSLTIAVIPAYYVQENNPPLPESVTPSDAELRGKKEYISQGCQTCHTQQVRSNIMDKTWGDRPSVPGDYAYNTRMSLFKNTASVMGSERTGPDLTSIGDRQPADDWHYLHLYNPRIVVSESIMPAYPWLFITKDEIHASDREINIPDEFKFEKGHVVVTEKAKDLIAYLKSLKQQKLPDYVKSEFNAYDWQEVKEENNTFSKKEVAPDGKRLYLKNCKVCHQGSGNGLKGSFPSLAGSKIVQDSDPSEMISIILYGVDRENEYGAMIPFAETLSDEQIAAIISFERSNWGNSAEEVTSEQVANIRNKGKPSNWPL